MDSFHYLARNILREEGVSLSQYYTLHLINAKSFVRMKDVKDDLCVSGACATAIIDSLVKKGYVERYRGEDDRRIIVAKLSHKGKMIVKHLNGKKSNFYSRLIKHMDEKDVNTVNNGLSLLVSSFDSALGLQRSRSLGKSL